MEEWRDRGIGLRQWMDGQGSGMDGWRGLPVDGQQRDGAQGTEGRGSRDRAQGMDGQRAPDGHGPPKGKFSPSPPHHPASLMDVPKSTWLTPLLGV